MAHPNDGLCNDCLDKILAWGSSKPNAAPFAINNGSSYDSSVHGVMERRAHRITVWKDLVRTQTNLIRTTCRSNH